VSNNTPLPIKKVAVAALLDGKSIRQIEALTGMHRDRIAALLRRVGRCLHVHLEDMVDTEGAELPPLCVEHLRLSVGGEARTFLDKLDRKTLDVVVVLSAVTRMVIHYCVIENDDRKAVLKFLEELGSAFVVHYVATHDFDVYENNNQHENGTTVEKMVEYLRSLGSLEPLGYKNREEAWKRVNGYTGLSTLSLFRKDNTAVPRTTETVKAVVAIYLVYYCYLRTHPLLDRTPAVVAQASQKPGDFTFTHLVSTELTNEEFDAFMEGELG
jgi:hypothetical protein